ncbi:MAG: glycine dehydrogenase (aminomethyl-transferring), partial [Proteobacteria bacterium]|nr:glycine dehydrogenase (aminomethyl-transferring) [Pseudomonadota bacterium]
MNMNDTHLSATLAQLEQRDDFVGRHIGPDESETRAMLHALGLDSLDQLVDRVIPSSIRSASPLSLPESRSEADALAMLREIAGKNRVFRSFIGAGYYDCHTPPVVLRNVLENPAWYTAYTPYQPEISQGRLEALLNFQTMVTDLTGMEIANASLLDEATAAAEAMAFCQRLSKNPAKAFFVSRDCHPQTIEVVRTRAEPLGFEVIVGNPATDLDSHEFFGVLLQYPATTGEVIDCAAIVDAAHAKKALVVVAADLLALTLLKPPGEFGADVAIG